MFDLDMVKKRHIVQFPRDCEAAFDMGKRLAASASAKWKSPFKSGYERIDHYVSYHYIQPKHGWLNRRLRTSDV
jgi:hypothetical protein